MNSLKAILTKITGKKCTCPSGFVCVSLKYTRMGKLGHQSSQLTNVEYLHRNGLMSGLPLLNSDGSMEYLLPAVFPTYKDIFTRFLKLVANFNFLRSQIPLSYELQATLQTMESQHDTLNKHFLKS